jgi:hypothetical protein
VSADAPAKTGRENVTFWLVLFPTSAARLANDEGVQTINEEALRYDFAGKCGW